eukprot:TRINITY_DN16416_c0_g1_i1.p1 TRINITY_DN16416_c0_g1~~TRINITY_DN16416_c0_g1_i1.p1  ORF type:complete len:335 (-),score=55.80 TRINITY_DN16416_c0_g1_i1:808-1812(-)
MFTGMTSTMEASLLAGRVSGNSDLLRGVQAKMSETTRLSPPLFVPEKTCVAALSIGSSAKRSAVSGGRRDLPSWLGARAESFMGTTAGLRQSADSVCSVERPCSSLVECNMRPRSPYDDDHIDGDRRVQQILVEMLKFQISKTRLSELVDERSKQLRNVMESAHQEYSRIADRSMKRVDDASSQVLRRLDVDAFETDKDLKLVRSELEAQADEFYRVQERMTHMRNEGLFFKNLYECKPLTYRDMPTKAERLQQELLLRKKAEELNDFSATYRKMLYGGLSLVVVSFIYSSSSAMLAGGFIQFPRLVMYGVVLSALLLQLVYSQSTKAKNDEAL